ncbi:STAS domain-containing protein [Shewanella sp. A25]|nr:STAS domain-containing protein [Shewanella shenzhenensis]
MANVIVISLPERFDFYYHKKFTSDYQRAFTDVGVNQLVLDFSRVLYIDSSALGMMVLLHRKALEKKISTSIRGLHGQAEDIIKIANMERLYRVEREK